MTINFHPKPGMILLCDFAGYIAPEMIKKRPVIVVSPYQLNRRRKCCTVVPLSTVAPEDIEDYHHRIPAGTYAFQDFYRDSWVKADMISTVAYQRLDRLKVHGQYRSINLSNKDFILIRQAVDHALQPLTNDAKSC